MKVKVFCDQSTVINQFQILMPHNNKKDTVFTGTDLKGLLQCHLHANLLKGACISGNFHQMHSYFE